MMEYRLLEEKDALLMKAFVDDQNTAYSPEQILAFLRQENAIGFVAAEGKKIAGFAYGYRLVKPDGRRAFYLHAIDVMEPYKNMGHGTRLMRFIEEYVKNAGCSKMFLMTEEGNGAACACYAKAGGVRKDAVLYEFS